MRLADPPDNGASSLRWRLDSGVQTLPVSAPATGRRLRCPRSLGGVSRGPCLRGGPTARRAIELDATTIAVLEGWRAYHAAEFAAVGISESDDWIFTDGGGEPIHPHAVYEAFRRIVHNAGIPRMRFHDLRHTHGSLLVKEGVP